MEETVGFSVIYRFKVHAGKEDSFRKGWALLTEAIREQDQSAADDFGVRRRQVNPEPVGPQARDPLEIVIAEEIIVIGTQFRHPLLIKGSEGAKSLDIVVGVDDNA